MVSSNSELCSLDASSNILPQTPPKCFQGSRCLLGSKRAPVGELLIEIEEVLSLGCVKGEFVTVGVGMGGGSVGREKDGVNTMQISIFSFD